jgi:Domain of unknown function (DUF222)/HNH endonuclease
MEVEQVHELENLRRAVDDLQHLDAGSAPDGVVCETIVALRREIERLESVMSAQVAVAHERGSASAVGYVSTAAFLRHRCHLTATAARNRVDAAMRMYDYPGVAAAFAAGTISYSHVMLLAKSLGELPAALATEAEPVLVEVAQRVDTARLAQAARRYRYMVDPDGQGSLDERHFERRWLEVASTFDGMVTINGLLDAESGAVLRTALDAAMRPPSGDEPHSAAQRRADALLEIVHQAMNHGALPDVAGERPHVIVVTDLATLRRDAESLPAQLSWGGPIGSDTARRIACDASVTRVVVDNKGSSPPGGLPSRLLDALPPQLRSPSLPLDVGRAARLATPAIRKALLVRDGGCAIAGCEGPAAWAEAHHIVHWADGGATSLANMVLLCRRHHRFVHERGWTISLRADGSTRFEAPLALTA